VIIKGTGPNERATNDLSAGTEICTRESLVVSEHFFKMYAILEFQSTKVRRTNAELLAHLRKLRGSRDAFRSWWRAYRVVRINEGLACWLATHQA